MASLRITKKKFKSYGMYMWGHDMINYMRLDSQLSNRRHKFPHLKWAQQKYTDNKGGDLW